MAHLAISTLGTPQITLDNVPVTGFISDKSRALLLYLAVEQAHPLRREALAALLWPEQTEQRARANLRRALANVRRVIGDAEGQFLHVTRQELQFNAMSDATVDLLAFERLLQDPEPGVSRMEQAVALVQGTFLSGFAIGDSVAFEEWVLVRREQILRRALNCLNRLTIWHESHHQPQIALRYAQQQTVLDPWYEPGQRQLLRLLARSGQRSAALQHYEQFAATLSAELAVAPESDTCALYTQIRDGELVTEQSKLPAFLAEPQPTVPAPFVARAPELTRLDAFLSQAVAAEGCIVFVSGEAGSGKTHLLHQFARQAQQHRAQLIPLLGACRAHVGTGDPYLPLRMVLRHLVGDIRPLWYDGTLNRQQVVRLWALRAKTVPLLQATAPDCLALLVDPLLLPEAARPVADYHAPAQDVLFQQLTRFLQRLSTHGPLLLLLDDLQWADSGTIDLLFYLRRQLVGFPILVVGAYRPEEVAAARSPAGERHPLVQLIQEVRRDGGDIDFSLDDADGRAFVDAWLDTVPNRLDETFRHALYQRTHGHALFTVELVAGMQERGELVRDRHGYWRVGATVSWDAIPARVDAVVGQRIGRLPTSSRRLLTAACVLGETFSAEIVAQMVDRPLLDVVQTLSGGLGRTHRLVEPLARLHLGQQTSSPYRFRHALYQQYLYDRLDPAERACLHQRAGDILEQTYQATALNLQTVAAQLAWHFEAAGSVTQALHYCRLAGEHALQLSAHRDAIAHLRRGLALLATMPQSAERTHQEIDLLIALGSALIQLEGYGSDAVQQLYERVHTLSEREAATPELVTALFWLATHRAVGGQLEQAAQTAAQLLAVSERTAAGSMEQLRAHMLNGLLLFFLGQNEASLRHSRQALARYRPTEQQALVYTFGQDPGIGAMIWQGHVLLHMGQLDAARRCLDQALAWAQQLDHPYTLAFTLLLAGCTPHIWYLDAPETSLRYARETLAVAEAGGFTGLKTLATFYLGYGSVCVSAPGDGAREGLALMEESVRQADASGDNQLGVSSRHLMLAVAYRALGRMEAALEAIATAEQIVEATGEEYFSAEIQRVKGELLYAAGDEHGAEACRRRAVAIAQAQHAALWERRATPAIQDLRHAGRAQR